MKATRRTLRTNIAVALCAVGFVMARATPYRQSTAPVDADGCRLVTDVIDKGKDQVAGSVVLVHGVAANKKIMGYLADAFAEQGLRVFVPDLPGHGRTPGPFSFARAESCTESLVQQLAARRMIDPKRTLLAGHSMGGAIALRVAARADVAGVIAISPAPMRAGPGVPADVLPYQNPPPSHENTLVISAAFEPFGIRTAAQKLVSADSRTSKFLLIPRATHVSVLFDPRVARASEDWAADVLGLRHEAAVPSSQTLTGSLVGFLGILLLAGPFIRTILGVGAQAGVPVLLGAQSPRVFGAFVQIVTASALAVLLLRFWSPFSFLHLYNGGYFAGFLLLSGAVILLVHYKAACRLYFGFGDGSPERGEDIVRDEFRERKSGEWPPEACLRRQGGRYRLLLGAALAAFAVHLLVTAWFDATLTEAWVSASRWVRFPVLFVAALAYFLAEELLLHNEARKSKLSALTLPLALRLMAWAALAAAVFVLHSGAILLILLAAFLFLFFVLQSAATNVVRKETGSALAAAVFSAILLAAFCLVIFPVT